MIEEIKRIIKQSEILKYEANSMRKRDTKADADPRP
jgi:hypothetical protein